MLQTWRPQKIVSIHPFSATKGRTFRKRKKWNMGNKGRDLAEKRGEGDSQNGDKERFQTRSLFSLSRFPHPSSREVLIGPISQTCKDSAENT